MLVLGQAKEALIAWAVSYDKPGQLPWPDRREVTPPSNYDGQSDCSNVNFNLVNSLGEPNFLGQIPRIDSTAPCESYSGVGHFKDSNGNNLWYAVSRNLVRNYYLSKDPIINPSLAVSSPYPWLEVRDINGHVVSDRVAVVIIAPGPPLAGQNRNTSAPPPSAFLDSITIGANAYSNYDYSNDDHEFIMGNNVTLNNMFNDRLIFITIDELIHAVEKRAANEIGRALVNYQATNGILPYAAPLGITSGFRCQDSTSAGFLPVKNGNSNCSFLVTEVLPSEFAVSSSCSFDAVEKIVFTRTSGDPYVNQNNNCTANGLSCSCTGEGSCSGGVNAPMFSCSAAGNCTSAPHASSNDHSEIAFEGGYFSSATGVCAPLVPTCAAGKGFPVTCSADNVEASGSLTNSCSDPDFNIGTSALPVWVTANRWHEYFYYQTSRDGSKLVVGSSNNVDAILIGSGAPLLAPSVAESKGTDQSRPSCEVSDYLDSTENANEDLVFDAHYSPRNSNYNDGVYIVAP